jgi:hypothetical protein
VGRCRTRSDLRLNLDIAAACYFDNRTVRSEMQGSPACLPQYS